MIHTPQRGARPRIPSESENRAAHARLEGLIRAASQQAEQGRAALAVVVGNGLSQLDLDYFKLRMSDLAWQEHAGRLSQDEAERRRAAICANAWEFFERWRLGTWSRLPGETTGLALLLQWILAGFTRLVFSSNYDLFLESLLLRWPGRTALRVAFNPVLANTPAEQAPGGLRQPRERRPLLRETPVRLFKCNGTAAFVAFEALDWTVWARPGAAREAAPGLRPGQLVTMEQLRTALVEAVWGHVHAFDTRISRFQQACHHVDAVAPSRFFDVERNGARDALESHADELLGVVVLGQWGQDGETLNDQILRFARDERKTVIQVLWYPPGEVDYQRKPSLWSTLPEGSRHLLIREHYGQAPGTLAPAEAHPVTAVRPRIPAAARARRQEEIRAIGAFAEPKQQALKTIEDRTSAVSLLLPSSVHPAVLYGSHALHYRIIEALSSVPLQLLGPTWPGCVLVGWGNAIQLFEGAAFGTPAAWFSDTRHWWAIVHEVGHQVAVNIRLVDDPALARWFEAIWGGPLDEIHEFTPRHSAQIRRKAFNLALETFADLYEFHVFFDASWDDYVRAFWGEFRWHPRLDDSRVEHLLRACCVAAYAHEGGAPLTAALERVLRDCPGDNRALMEPALIERVRLAAQRFQLAYEALAQRLDRHLAGAAGAAGRPVVAEFEHGPVGLLRWAARAAQQGPGASRGAEQAHVILRMAEWYRERRRELSDEEIARLPSTVYR